jgi:RND family efflux transporter MFP subunit
MASMKKIIGLSVLVVAAIVFMAWLAGLLHFGKITPGLKPLKAAPAAGQVLTVREQAIPQELEVMGAVISKSLSQVAAQVPGRVAKIWVEAGSRVQAGQPLVTLSATEYQAKLNQAQAGVTQAQAELKQVTANYQRYQYLYKEGAASPKEFEAMEARYQSAKGALAAARAQAQEAATFKGYTVVKAPEAAVVAERRAAVGDLAQPGQPLLSLYNPDRLQIEGEVNDSYRQQVQVGERVQVTVAAVRWQADLPLEEIFPISQSASRTFKVRTTMFAEPLLVPGMFARLQLPLGQTRGLLIPQEAVHRIGQLTMVKVLVDHAPQLRQVKLGRQLDHKVEVLAGLKSGDQIVLPE